MSKNSNRHPSTVNSIREADDTLIACYSRANYDLRHFKSPALAWFIQFAIRADVEEAWKQQPHFGDTEIQISGYIEIHEKGSEIRALIRKKHVLDESDLASIGLSIDSFPTLHDFFTQDKSKHYVREATVCELENCLDDTRKLVLKSELWKFFPVAVLQMNEKASEIDPAGYVSDMTFSEIERKAAVPEGEVSTKKLFLVDVTAPITILKEQFSKAIERGSKQKILTNSLYENWDDFGVLPYIDIQIWKKQEKKVNIPLRTQALLIYPKSKPSMDEKKVRETTEPHATRMLDVKSQAFCSLKTAASEEFEKAVQFALEPDTYSAPNAEVAEEALSRWFPRLFPHWMPNLRRARIIWQDEEDIFHSFLERMKSKPEEKLSVAERIRRFYPEFKNNTLLDSMKGLPDMKDDKPGFFTGDGEPFNVEEDWDESWQDS